MIVSLAFPISEPLYLSPGFASPEIPLVLALITSVVLTIWVTAYLLNTFSSPDPASLAHATAIITIWWPCESSRYSWQTVAYDDAAAQLLHVSPSLQVRRHFSMGHHPNITYHRMQP